MFLLDVGKQVNPTVGEQTKRSLSIFELYGSPDFDSQEYAEMDTK